MHKRSSNRSFGLLFFVFFLVISFWLFTKNSEINLYLISIALIFLRIYSDSFNLYLPFMLTVGVGIQKLLPMMQQAYLNYAQIKSTTASLSSLLSLIKQPVNKESYIYKNNVFKDKIVLVILQQ